MSARLVPLLAACAAAAGVGFAGERDLGGKVLGGDGPPVGVGAYVRPGAWIPVGPVSGGPVIGGKRLGGEGVVAVTDGDGLLIGRSLTFTDGGTALVQAGRAESDVTVRFPDFPGFRWAALPGEDFTVLGPRDRLWAAVDLPAASVVRPAADGEDDDGGAAAFGYPLRVAEFATPAGLPAVPGGLSSVRVLIAEAGDGWTPEVADRVGRWVTGGGHLILSASPDGGPSSGTPLPAFVPLELRPAGPLTGYTALEELAKRGSGLGGAAALNRLVPATARPVDLGSVRAADGRTLARGDGGALVAEVPVGFGRVTVLAASLHAAPFRAWAGLPGFLRELTRAGSAGATAGGGRELAEQVYAAVEPARAGGRASWSPGAVGLLVLAAVLLLGPVDWFLCHRVLKRPAATWATLPVWLAAIAGGAWWAAGGDVAAPTRLEIADFDSESGRVRGSAWATVPAPAGGRADVTLAPAADFGGDPTARLGYAADPSAGFGGLFRGGGSGAVTDGYVIEDTTARGVPLPEGAAARLRLDWDETGASVPVRSLLRSDGGRLSGSVSHDFPGPLRDALLIYGGRVYRPDPSKRLSAAGGLDPGEEFRPADLGVERRDLRGFLTQVRKTASRLPEDEGDETRERFTTSRYDPAGGDLSVILPVLSFYERAGGAGYTGLSNAELEPLDLSAAAATGRAILLGRLDAPLTGLAVDFGGAAVPAGASHTLVRVLLPVPEGRAGSATGPAADSPPASTPAIGPTESAPTPAAP